MTKGVADYTNGLGRLDGDRWVTDPECAFNGVRLLRGDRENRDIGLGSVLGMLTPAWATGLRVQVLSKCQELVNALPIARSMMTDINAIGGCALG
jgi:hypothetical protein